MKAIIYTTQNGDLAVCVPCEGARLAKGYEQGGEVFIFSPRPIETVFRKWPVAGVVPAWAETEDEFVARIAAKDVPSSTFKIVDSAAIPQDRTFRNAWMLNATGVGHDMTKCREIHKKNLRRLRIPKMAALDVEYMRADEAGDTAKKATVAQQKKALRDVTSDPRIASASTPEELKAVIPPVLA